MTPLYLLAAAAGVPLVVWFLLSGGDEGGDGEGGDGADGGADDGFGAIMVRLFPLSTIALAVATFGITGLALDAAGTSAGTTLVAAVVLGVLAGVINSTAFSYLRRSESGIALRDDQLAGAVGHVVLPVAADRRGRVAVSSGGQQRYFSAQLPPGEALELEPGDPVLVIEVCDGIAIVGRLDPELT